MSDGKHLIDNPYAFSLSNYLYNFAQQRRLTVRYDYLIILKTCNKIRPKDNFPAL